MRLGVVIPARLDSSRVPRKALADIDGLPLIEHVRRRAIAAEVGPVVVATDSDAIASAVEGFGGEVARTGAAENGTQRVALAIAGRDWTHVLNVQGDQPRLDPEHVRALARLAATADLATVAADLDPAVRDDPSVVKVRIEAGRAVDFRRDAPPGYTHRHLGLYAFTRDALLRVTSRPVGARARAEGLEQLTWLEGGWSIQVVCVGSSAPAVDTLAQLEAVRGG
ncbi:MAG: NTP transferase domain-containing protein [Alphaproteobacteria bacterium]|nr:NTP transferase domain-containing protein [Alphaproteobacteria bacterium]